MAKQSKKTEPKALKPSVKAAPLKPTPYAGSGYMMTPGADTPAGGWGRRTNKGDFSGNAAPRVGGSAPKSTAGPLKGASKSQVKAAKSMVRKGTGSGASKAAKASKRKLR